VPCIWNLLGLSNIIFDRNWWSFLRNKAATAWNWILSNKGWELVALHLHFSCMSSWHSQVQIVFAHLCLRNARETWNLKPGFLGCCSVCFDLWLLFYWGFVPCLLYCVPFWMRCACALSIHYNHSVAIPSRILSVLPVVFSAALAEAHAPECP
jgi:hypothetical protein